MIELPDHLLATYRDYKKNEKELLVWITITAQAINGKPQQSEQKLRDRKRTLARRAKKQSTSTVLSDSTKYIGNEPDNVISLFDVLDPAMSIAASDSPSSIPRNIATALYTVLALRKRCLVWYQENTPRNDFKTRRRNKRHEYPIHLLEKVKTILHSKLPDCDSKQSTNSIIGEVVEEGFSVMAECEDMDKSSTQALDHPDDIVLARDTQEDEDNRGFYETDCGVGSARGTSRTNPSKDEQNARMQDEFLLARFCLSEDIQSLEDYVTLEFARFALDQANADSLAFVVSTAIDMVMSMEDELKNQFVNFKECERSSWNVTLNEEAAVVCSAPLLRMQAVLAAHTRATMESSPHSQQSQRGSFDPKASYFGATDEEQWQVELLYWKEFQAVYMRIETLERRLYFPFCADLVHRFASEASTKTGIACVDSYIGIGAAFAVRLGLLAIMIFRDLEEATYNHISDSVKFIQKAEPAFLKFWRSTEQRSDQLMYYYWRQNDGQHEAQQSVNQKYDRVLNTVLRTSLQFDSLLCLMNPSLIRMQFASRCIKIMEVDQVVQPLAHLYNLMKEEGLLTRDWHDLVALQTVLSEKYFFQDTRPTLSRSNNAEKLRKRMLWAVGVKSKDLESCMSDDPQDSEWSAKRVRATFTSRQLPFYTILTERPMRALLDSSLATEYMELVVGANVVPRALGLPEIMVDLGRDEDGGHANLHNRPELWKHVESRPRLRPVDLLAAIKIGLEKEFRMMSFDYLAFQRAC